MAGPSEQAATAGGGMGPLAAILAPERPRLLLAVALRVVASVASLVPFVAIYELARELVGGAPDNSRVWTVAGVAVGAVLVRFLFQDLAANVTHAVDMDIQLRLRRRMTEHLGAVPLGWFTDNNSGQVKKALQDDVEALHYAVAHAVLDLAGAIAAPIAALVYLVTVDWRLALLTLITLPVYAMFHRAKERTAGEHMGELGGAMGRINSAVVEFVQGIAVVKTFGQARRAHDTFAQAADDYMNTFGRVVRPILRLEAVSSAIVAPAVMLLVVAVEGAVFAGLGWVQPVDVLPFLLLGLGLTAPLGHLAYFVQNFMSAVAAAKSIHEVLDTPPLAAPEKPGLPDGHRVEFVDVAFSYDGENQVLDGVTATLEPGTVTAVVGPSGSGKSTLAKLLPRFYDVTGGSVRIGGVDVREVPADQLYRQVGFVLQDVQLLRASLLDNIRLGRPGATLDEVRAVARAAQIDARLTALPRGYDSVVGEDAHLSGGEAQRVSIARALLADTPVLVLDEATAYADPESEAAIQDALSELVAGRTVLVIAHRLSTIVDADQIVVLDGGRVVERGRHEELIAAEGRYHQMWRAYQSAVPGGTDETSARVLVPHGHGEVQ
ncbi:ABC transporter ATP-binding protein [Streptoalloteichus hindustanus]|uniref:ATP-binding cassette, subfamily B n=1 Tax=Streptoalloteichus hindustanus TaxID=2017 RepID=A0A1M5L6W8_STRHI|nr:ABC transporter ATP-binding protein [Streptoalloteichus hindustanus]SHG60778.1 ATP-binding cassette, subfamily B [Streptoalloteichus hindustanus]